jgi:serine/threonine protein kinase
MSEPTQRLSAAPPAAVSESPESAFAHEALPLTLVSEASIFHSSARAPVTFPGYEILDELGRGGMGVVYRARQQNLNRLVALKVIRGGPLASCEDKARFRIEAEAAARLQHPNIVQVYDVGEYAGFSYISLELIEGQTLRQWQHGEKIEPTLAARFVSAIAHAIQHAHEQGIVHRDIKPANILLAPTTGATTEHLSAASESEVPRSSIFACSQSDAQPTPLALTPKVTDFGLAKSLDGANDLTITGVSGTPNYMAPEQVRGKGLSLGVDVYALGAVLYELLTGRPPFVGSDPAEVMNQILESEAPPVRRFAPGVPRDLAVIVAKCLEKDPRRRYPTARDVADDLDRFLAGRQISARSISTPERAWRWVRRSPVAAAFLFFTTAGCTITGGLAVALAKLEADERRAHESAVVAREEAEKQRRDAEAVRDELKVALAAAENTRQLAERERAATSAAKEAADHAREVAKQEAKRTVEQRNEADAARARSEDSLRVARGVIRVSLRELSRHPRFEDEDFRDARLTLIKQVRNFRNTVTQHAPNTPEWLDDIADVSHWLGFLEYLNNNPDAAAAEYRTAADAAGRWAKLEPHKSEPRARQAHSLVNAGNALFNARRFREAEATYRDAIKLYEVILAEFPRNELLRRQSVEAYDGLSNVLNPNRNVR